MGRIHDALARARAEGRTAVIAYFCAGDPDVDTTVRVVLAAARAGADLIELGMPFSDPTADGPVIQRASERALKNGMTVKKTLEVAARIRAESEVPLILFGYYNPVLAHGEQKLVRDAAASGIDGFLIVDLPPEESAVLREPALAAGLSFIPFVAITSSEARIALAASVADAFIYYVSITGVTGAASADYDEVARKALAVRTQTGKSVAVGFGVSSGADVQKLARHVDGVIVGSALVRAVESANGPEEAESAVAALVADLARGAKIR